MTIFTTADKFKVEAENLIISEIDRLKESMAIGYLENYESYKHVAGKISGLRSALELLNEAEAVCNGKPH